MNQAILSARDRNDETLISWSSKVFLPLIGPIVAFALVALLIACSTPNHLPVDAHPTQSINAGPISETSPSGTLPLRVLTDIPLTGGTTRLDYQSLDSGSGRLYIAHWALT